MSAQTELAKRLAMRLKALESAAPSDLGRKLRIASKNYFGETHNFPEAGWVGPQGRLGWQL